MQLRPIQLQIAAAAALLIAGVATVWWWRSGRTFEPECGTKSIADRDESEATPPATKSPDEKRTTNNAARDAVVPAPPAAGVETAAMAPDDPIHGVVVDPVGNPIAGATVQAMDWLGAVAGRSSTDESGGFAFEKLKSEARHLHVSAPGRLATIVVVGPPDRWYRFASVSNSARIVLEPGVVAVARLRYVDGSPCAGLAVHLGPSFRQTTGVDHEPQIGPWPPPVTDQDGRVVIDGLPPGRVVGLGIDLLGRNEDSPRPLETGTAISAAAAGEQLFVYAKLTTLTIELRGLEALAAANLSGTLSIERTDGFHGEAEQRVPPFVARFEEVILGGRYRIGLAVPGRRFQLLQKSVRIVQADQHLALDCPLPPPEVAAPAVSERWFAAPVELVHPDRTPITVREMLDAGLGAHDLSVRCGSLESDSRDAPARSGDVDFESNGEESAAMTGRLRVRERPPLWLEGEFGPLRSRVEVDHADDSAKIVFTFDLAPLSVGLTRLSFRVRDERAGDVAVASVQLAERTSGSESLAIPVAPGLIARMVRPGSYHYRCNASNGGLVEGDVDVPAGSPVTVDLVIADPGDVCGTVAPLPDAARIVVSRSPIRGTRSRFDWWGGCTVGPDGSYSLSGVPPGEWRLVLSIVSPDESSVRVETATVAVKSNAITRHDFVTHDGPTRRFRFDFGKASSALVHATDAHDETVSDCSLPAGAILELPVEALHFSASPQIRDEWSWRWDTSHWTEGRITPGDDGVATVRFDFSGR